MGAIVGTGIFVVVGEGAASAGPAVILSFALAALTCLFSALSYAELASSIPVCGERLHLHLRDARRNRGVDHRLGSDLGVRRVRRCSGSRLGRQLERVPRKRFR